MTQRSSVLRMLRDAGSKGVHTFDLRRSYIGNPSERIRDLEAAGFTIAHAREQAPSGTWGTRYTLVAEPEPARSEETDRLFELPNEPANAIFGEAA